MKQQKIFSIRIITVDDSAVVAERLQSMLNELEEVEYMGNAINISSALELIQEKEPHVVVLDIHLRDDLIVAGGVHLLIQLKRKYPEMKIIMLTNLSDAHYRSACMTFGADYFFDKTIDFEKIPAVLKEIQALD